jgi:hypothetical protein
VGAGRQIKVLSHARLIYPSCQQCVQILHLI